LKRLHLDGVREGPSAGSRWLPLRAALGVQAFGVSAYRGEPGEAVVPEHREVGEGAGNHQELYVVVRGAARFEVDDESFDAPAGTLVLVERGERRRAEATEPQTVVLAVGAPVGEAYRIAPWEYGSRAAYARAAGDIDELDRIVVEGTATYGNHVTMQIGRACVAAQRGRLDDARAELARAYDDPDFGDWARAEAAAEPLLAALRDDA
jgi:quercetin dioxygenase-like cupin family protein